MASKEEWKNTGKEMGDAFMDLAKSVIRSAKVGIEKAEEWAEPDEKAEPQPEGSNVFNDGTWRETGKSLGSALKSFSATLMSTIEEGAGRAEEWADESKSKAEETVSSAAEHADRAADNIRHAADDFAEGFKEAEEGDIAADAEVISEETFEE